MFQPHATRRMRKKVGCRHVSCLLAAVAAERRRCDDAAVSQLLEKCFDLFKDGKSNLFCWSHPPVKQRVDGILGKAVAKSYCCRALHGHGIGCLCRLKKRLVAGADGVACLQNLACE